MSITLYFGHYFTYFSTGVVNLQRSQWKWFDRKHGARELILPYRYAFWPELQRAMFVCCANYSRSDLLFFSCVSKWPPISRTLIATIRAGCFLLGGVTNATWISTATFSLLINYGEVIGWSIEAYRFSKKLKEPPYKCATRSSGVFTLKFLLHLTIACVRGTAYSILHIVHVPWIRICVILESMCSALCFF